MTRRNIILAVLALIVLIEVFVPDGYARVLEIHLDVLGGMAQKMSASAASGKRPTPNDLTELIYPLERARGFVGDYRGEEQRRSYIAFVELLDLYRDFVSSIDEARSTPERWQGFLPQLPARGLAVEEAVAGVRATLAAES